MHDDVLWQEVDAIRLNLTVPAGQFIWRGVEMRPGSSGIHADEAVALPFEVTLIPRTNSSGIVFFSVAYFSTKSRDGESVLQEWVAAQVDNSTKRLLPLLAPGGNWPGEPRAALLLAGGTVPFNIEARYQIPSAIGPAFQGDPTPVKIAWGRTQQVPNATFPVHSAAILENLTTENLALMGYAGQPVNDSERASGPMGKGVSMVREVGCSQPFSSTGSGFIAKKVARQPELPDAPRFDIRTIAGCPSGEVARRASFVLDSVSEKIAPFVFAMTFDFSNRSRD